MATLTHIGVLFSAQLQAILMAFVGLVAGILYWDLALFTTYSRVKWERVPPWLFWL